MKSLRTHQRSFAFCFIFLLFSFLCYCACPTKNLEKRRLTAVRNGSNPPPDVMPVHPVRTPEAQPEDPDNRFFLLAGPSMEPTFQSGSYVLISSAEKQVPDKLSRGRTIIFKRPETEKKFFVKRIIGKPGETVQIRKGNVLIKNNQHRNGALLDETRYLSECQYTSGDGSWRLSSNQYFVLGDNRDNSRDSRHWGPLPADQIVGRLLRKTTRPSISE